MILLFVSPAAVAVAPRSDNGQINLQPELMEEMNCTGGPRCRLATALQEVWAADQQLQGEDHSSENETADPPTDPEDKLKVAREKLEAIHASEMKDNSKEATVANNGANTGPTTGSNTGPNTVSNTGPNTGSNTGQNTGSNTGQNTGSNTGQNNTGSEEQTDIDKIRGNGKERILNNTGGNDTGKTVILQSIRFIEDETTEWMLKVPLWIEMMMRVFGVFVGAFIVYWLHHSKYRAVHGCATVFCIFYCCPCGFLTVCFPIDEATPETNDEPDEEWKQGETDEGQLSRSEN